jgi:hypothetical protein
MGSLSGNGLPTGDFAFIVSRGNFSTGTGGIALVKWATFSASVANQLSSGFASTLSSTISRSRMLPAATVADADCSVHRWPGTSQSDGHDRAALDCVGTGKPKRTAG